MKVMKNLIYGIDHSNPYIHSATVLCDMYMYCIESSVKSVLQESQGLTRNTFVVLLLAMIYLHMLIFRLMVTVVAEFCSLVKHS